MMLDPDQRTNFLDLLRPPSGYRLAEAVGTTYSMDFVGLTSVLLAFVDAETDNDSEQPNQVELLRAITRLARCVRVFVSRGRITEKDVARHGKLSSLFDRFVREVHFQDGCFHPKVWVARYEPKASADALGQKPLVRIVCASRNLTQGSRWEIFAAFEGQENGALSGNGPAREVADFLRQLDRSTEADDDLVSQLAAVLVRVQLDRPREMGNACQFKWQWHEGTQLWSAFPPRGVRALVVSPFVRASFLSRIVSGFDRITLLSTQNELDALSDTFYRELAPKSEIFVVRSAETEDGSPAMQLHAKLFIAETSAERTVLLGSANASDSAWKSRNCEAVVSFSPGLSIDQFRQAFIFSPKPVNGEQAALRGWVERYERRPVVDDETVQAEKELDRLHKLLVGLEFSAQYDGQNQSLRVQCPELASQPPLVEAVAQHRLRLCPLSRLAKDSDLVDAGCLPTTGVDFRAFRLLDLTEFLVLEIQHPATVPRQFIVKATTDYSGLRDERDTAILNEYLTAESFRVFLRAILFDGINRGTPRPGQKSKTEKGDDSGWSLLGEITLEEVIQSCTEDSTRIGEINQLLKVFGRTKAADGEFTQFHEFWTAFQAAHAEAKGSSHA